MEVAGEIGLKPNRTGIIGLIVSSTIYTGDKEPKFRTGCCRILEQSYFSSAVDLFLHDIILHVHGINPFSPHFSDRGIIL